MSGGPAPVAVHIVHATEARLRLHAPGLRNDAEAMGAFADRVSEVPGIVRILGRPRTATVTLELEDRAPDVARRLVEQGFVSVTRPAPTPPVSMVAQLALARLDYLVRNRTDGVFDFRSATATFLIAAALFQAARGRFVGPAATLLMGALAMIEASSRRQE